MPRINVIKPFIFTRPPLPDMRLPLEQRFGIGDGQVIDDYMANHPWIKEHLADGCIESPEAAAEKAKAAKEKADKDAADAAVQLQRAEQALARAVATTENPAAAAIVEEGMDTPVNEIASQRGEGITAKDPGKPSGKGKSKAAKEKADKDAADVGTDSGDGATANADAGAPAQ